jgi:NAD(P)-dependent dehydrogenase (short-subunit alcohol dehydrogenase family)
MRKQGSGAIVNCSSIGGIVGRAGSRPAMAPSAA